MAILRTTRGDEILIDDEFHSALKSYKWWSHSKGYAVTRFRKGHPQADKRKYIHQLILEIAGVIIPPGMQIDHINQNGFDNRLENLRVVTPQQNLWNSRNRRNKTSKYRGVSWYSRDSRWRAAITIGGKHKHIGFFDSEKKAANAYQNFIKTQMVRRNFINSNYF